MNAPFPSGSLPAYVPSFGYEAPIYDEEGYKHDPYTDEWFKTLQQCADIVFGEGVGVVDPKMPIWRSNMDNKKPLLCRLGIHTRTYNDATFISSARRCQRCDDWMDENEGRIVEQERQYWDNYTEGYSDPVTFTSDASTNCTCGLQAGPVLGQIHTCYDAKNHSGPHICQCGATFYFPEENQ